MQGNDNVTNAILKTLFTSSSPLRHFPQKEKKKKKKGKGRTYENNQVNKVNEGKNNR